MFDELTPEQAYELCVYSAMEPFGEVRADLRAAAQMKQVYDVNRSKRSTKLALGEFMLYNDLASAAESDRKTQSLVETLNSMTRQPKKDRSRG